VDKDIVVEQGISIGAVWVISQVAKQLGIVKALGSDDSARLAIWQVSTIFSVSSVITGTRRRVSGRL